MAFEIGKTYTFRQNEIVASRESGKLFFQVKDPASATPLKVRPFDFQGGKIPEKLVCVYRGNGVMEQTVGSVVEQVYTPGECYKFRVMLQEGQTGPCSVRDDVNGLFFGGMDLGPVHFSRFQRIKCKVVSTDGGYLKLQYVKEQQTPRPEFKMETILALEPSGALGRRKLMSRVLSTQLFAEADLLRRGGEASWVNSALDVVKKYMPQWLAANPAGRAPWLSRLRALAINIMEKSAFLNEFAPEERMKRQEELTAFVDDCEDYAEALKLIHEKADEKFIVETLDSMERTGWLYNPERKMRQMMALFTLRNSYAHTYISQIFSVIRERHADGRFMNVFGRGFIQMLSIYIGNEAKFANPFNRNALRELIEAIAIELLLTRDEEYPQWNLHRGMLYTLAALIVDQPASPLPDKALAAYTERFDQPLEFDWRDLDDITRMCHAKLNTSMGPNAVQKGSTTVFEGETSRLTVGDGGMSFSPAETGVDTRTVLTRHPMPSAPLKVKLNTKLKEKANIDAQSLQLQHNVWTEIERSLSDPMAKEPVASVTPKKPKIKAKALPEVGDRVTFRVVRRDDFSPHIFHCIIEDENFEGRATIQTANIVLYPISANIEMFELDGKPLLLHGVVESIDKNGVCSLSMRKDVNEFLAHDAIGDRDAGVVLTAVITDVREDKCFCVTEKGYPAILPIPVAMEFQKQDCVDISIDSVTFHPRTDKLFINARFENLVEGRIPEENYKLVGQWFHFLMCDMADDLTYSPDAETAPAAPVLADGHEEEETNSSQPEAYLDARSVGELSRLFDFMALVNRSNLWKAYNYLAVARVLAQITGDIYRSEYLGVKMSLLESLQKFGTDGRVDSSTVETLTAKCNNFLRMGDADMIQRLGILRTLSTLDRPDLAASVSASVMPRLAAASAAVENGEMVDTSTLSSLKKMVGAYNLLRGLKLNPTRQKIKGAIYDLLDLEMPSMDTNRVNASEDQHNEFKESLVYPAGNSMHPDERRQGREIMETICGFLNSEGGTLYIGVSNLGVAKGLGADFIHLNSGYEEYDLADVQDKFNLLFTRNMREQFGVTTADGAALYPEYVTMDFEDIDDKWICRVNIKPYPGMVRMTDEAVFLRQGANTLPLKTRREQLAFEKKRKTAK